MAGNPGSYLNVWIEGKLKCPRTVTDAAGNNYKTVKTIDQCRMVENSQSRIVGGLLKEGGTAHWDSPNTAATNASGFTALGGGYRSYFNSFTDGRR
jgi:hypothetical protein